MKQKFTSIIFACALLSAIVMSGRSYVNSISAHATDFISSHVAWADGGVPIPPLPPPPPPPPPGSGNGSQLA